MDTQLDWPAVGIEQEGKSIVIADVCATSASPCSFKMSVPGPVWLLCRVCLPREQTQEKFSVNKSSNFPGNASLGNSIITA